MLLGPLATTTLYNAIVRLRAFREQDLFDNCEGRLIITLGKDGQYDFNDNVAQFVVITNYIFMNLSVISNSSYGLTAYAQDIRFFDFFCVTITATSGLDLRTLP